MHFLYDSCPQAVPQPHILLCYVGSQPYNKTSLSEMVQQQVRIIALRLWLWEGTCCYTIGVPHRLFPAVCLVSQYAEYIYDLHFQQVFKLVDTANYLGIKPLVDLCLARFGYVIKGTSRHIRMLFSRLSLTRVLSDT